VKTHLYTPFVIPCLTRNLFFLLDSCFRGNDNSCGLTYELHRIIYPYGPEEKEICLDEMVSTFNILSKKFPDYENRPQQIEMANEVYTCLKDRKNFIVKAGTGVGKSFAYLVPAILLKKKTIVSTATLALQDQLVNKDIIFLQKALPQQFSFAILKGKNNYTRLLNPWRPY
jgi:hypothetical protein